MNKLWNYRKRSRQLVINFTSNTYICNGAYSYLQIDPSINKMYMKQTYERLESIINTYEAKECIVIVNCDYYATKLVKKGMYIIIAKYQYKGVKFTDSVHLTTIYGPQGQQKANQNLFIEDFINVRLIIELEYRQYEKMLYERIATKYFTERELPLRKADTFFEINKGAKRYAMKYKYTKGKGKLIIIFNTLNGSKNDCEHGLFNTIQMTDYNFKDYAVLNCYESLSGYDGFYTYVFGESLIEEITNVLRKFIHKNGYTRNNVFILSNGTGAIPGVIYANRLHVRKHISVNPRVNLYTEFSKKRSSSIGNQFTDIQLIRLNKYFQKLLAMEHNNYYFTNEKELLLNMKNLNELQVNIIGSQKVKNQLPKLIK